jgi:hypothetical protein
MSSEMEAYLSKVRLWMFGMPKKAKNGIIDELRSHIMDSIQAIGGTSAIEAILEGMDSPRRTAKRYRSIYGFSLPFKILFVLITIFLSFWTVPIWEIVSPGFSTTFVFLVLLIFLLWVGIKAGKRMALVAGISSLLTRFIVLGIIVAAAGEQGVIQGGGVFAFLLASLLLIVCAYLPARTMEKWEERVGEGMSMMTPAQINACPRCHAPIPVQSKFCMVCGSRVF